MANSNQIHQASVVPFRASESGFEFCLITTRKSQRWGFPKGRVRNHEKAEDAALKEAHEEAGLTGRIVGAPLGQYAYSKSRQERTVSVLLMAVEGCEDSWKESHQRNRRWATLAEARSLLDRPHLIQLLQDAVELLQSTPVELLDSGSINAGSAAANVERASGAPAGVGEILGWRR